MPKNYLSNLNEEQQAACNAPLGRNLVIASAGTGKTSTIVGRICVLLERGIKPSEILLLTFTNKAASEMISRVASIFSKEIASEINAGTFHSIAYRYLRENNSALLKQPRELKILFKSVYDKFDFTRIDGVDSIESNELKSSKKDSKNSQYSYQYLYDIFSLYQNSTTSKDFATWLKDKNEAQMQYVDTYMYIFDEFNALKREYGYADYNDLLILYKEALSALQKQNKIPYIEVLCDEFQDTNALQDSILKAINPKSLFCVGDYDQSIYAFNGADISIITNFKNEYPNASIFTLSKNYRSTRHILDLANKVIANNPRIYPKSLEVINTKSAHKPRVLEYNDLYLQYSSIARIIFDIQTKNIAPLDEIAIIYRNNSSADGLEVSLKSLGIASKRKGSTNFFDTKEIEFLLCLCSILASTRDMMSYIHIFSHAKGIGNSTAKEIYDALKILGNGSVKDGILHPDSKIECYKRSASNSAVGLFGDFFVTQERGRFDSILNDDFKSHPLLSHHKINMESAIFFNDFYEVYRQNIGTKNPSELLSNLIKSKFYARFLESVINARAKNKDGSIDSVLLETKKTQSQQRIAILHNLSKNYKDLHSFLNAMMLGSSELAQGEGVNLLSIHASKGLEFKCVFVVDLMEGRFPNHKLVSKGGSLQEERRLFYVAATRAKEYLFLSYALNDNNKDVQYAPSIFLKEANIGVATSDKND